MNNFKLATTDYNKLVDKKIKIADAIAKTNRQKELRVDTINKKYESKLDKLIRKQNEIGLILDQTKEYVRKN